MIGLAGWSGAGKTTLIVRLLPLLRARGLAVSTLKHAHHGFDLDRPGKDSFLHREAGAQEVLVASPRRWALMREARDEPEPGLAALLGRFSPCDLVLVEGFRGDHHAKLEVHRAGNGKPFLFPQDSDIVAVASDAPPPPFVTALPCLHLDDVEGIASLVVARAVPIDETLRRLRVQSGR